MDGLVAMVTDVCACTEAKAKKALEIGGGDVSAAVEIVLSDDPRLQAHRAARDCPLGCAPFSRPTAPTGPQPTG